MIRVFKDLEDVPASLMEEEMNEIRAICIEEKNILKSLRQDIRKTILKLN